MNEVRYEWDHHSDNSICLAFSKSRADDRKAWLSTYDPKRILNTDSGRVSLTSFVNDELIHFSNADNLRSIPHLMDGLKPSQRKIVYCALKRNLHKEIKVAQLAGYVSEHASYHHGEASLTSTIIGMAQNFMGSNTINLFQPIGQFGSRLLGGKDSAAARYIHTALEPIVGTIIHKTDEPLLNVQEEDGMAIEPEYYLPTVPMLAINGSLGIGTGFSTYIPPHNPKDIVALMRARLNGGLPTLAGRALDPWWWGFRGQVARTDAHTWVTMGTYTMDDTKQTVTITELPVGVWTKEYKEMLDKMCATDEAIRDSGLKNFDDLYNDVDVCFVLYLTEDAFDMARDTPMLFMKKFGLTSSWKTSNMVCFEPVTGADAGGDKKMNIVKYSTVGDMLEAFYMQRIGKYVARKEAQLKALEEQHVEIDARRRFLMAVIDDRMTLIKQTDESIVEQMKREKLPPLSAPDAPDTIEAYEYLMRMRIDRVKAKAIEDMKKHLDDILEDIAELKAKTANDLWEEDLDEFEGAWEKMIAARQAEREGKPMSKKLKITRKKV
jgi:DNA topoisomerase-2